MHQALTAADLRMLLESQPAPCISLYMPTHAYGPEAQQDRVRFGNLLREAKTRLGGAYDKRRSEALFEPLEAMSESSFWRGHAHSLAVFRSPALTAHFRLPLPLPELTVVADSFHVTPLTRYLQSNRHFHLLALSRQGVRVCQGTPYGLRELALPLPPAVGEAPGMEDRESVLSYHVVQPGRSTPIYHGHGVPPEENAKDELTRFFRSVDDALRQHLLRDERAPLVLAGVGYLHPVYRAVSRYQHVAAKGLEGNFERASLQELHRRVWPLAAELLAAREDALLDEFAAALPRGQASATLEEVARAVVAGRVRVLLLADGRHVWGEMNRTSGEIVRHPEQMSTRDDDLLDDLAESTLAAGGEVLTVPAGRLPDDAPAAALLRW